jgi:DNA repair exonuclease SbcCD ATPase subunit
MSELEDIKKESEEIKKDEMQLKKRKQAHEVLKGNHKLLKDTMRANKEMTESEKIKDAYIDGVCPDCQEPIPDDVVEGEGCKNCSHSFWLDDSDEAANGYYTD